MKCMVLLAPLKNFENNNFQKHPKISSFLLVFMTYKLLCLSTKWLFLSCYHFSHQNVSFTASRWLYLKQKASQVVPLLKCEKLPKSLWCLQRMNSISMTRPIPPSSLKLFSFSQWHHIQNVLTPSHMLSLLCIGSSINISHPPCPLFINTGNYREPGKASFFIHRSKTSSSVSFPGPLLLCLLSVL